MKLATTITIALATAVLAPVGLVAQDKSPAKPKPVWSVVEGNRQKLWRAGITAPPDDKESSELKELLLRIEALGLSSVAVPTRLPKPASPGVAAVEATTQPTLKVATVTKSINPRTKPKPQTLATTVPASGASELLEKVSRLDPNTVDAPRLMADALFLAGQQAAAAPFYEVAAEKETDDEEKAWLLFQAANCRRKEDPQAALRIFAKLIDGHAESMWATIARRQKAIIEWQEETNLSAILEEARQMKLR